VQLGNKLYFPVAGKTGVLGDESDDAIADLFKFYHNKAADAAYKDENGNILGKNWVAMNTSGRSNYPTYETNSMAVRLLAANGLIDGKTYNLVLTIKEGRGTNAYNVVSKVNIKVTKVMPTDLPEKFAVLPLQVDNAKKLPIYLRPKNNRSTHPWNITSWFTTDVNALKKYPTYGLEKIQDLENYNEELRYARWAEDARPYNYEEIFDGLILSDGSTDPNYKFVFEGLGSYEKHRDYDIATDFSADAVTLYRNNPDVTYSLIYDGLDRLKNPATGLKPGYYLPYVYYENAKTYDKADKTLKVKVGYTYQDISLVINKFGTIQKVNGQNMTAAEDAASTNYDYSYNLSPRYFDKDGNTVANAADNAFNVYFSCAFDNTTWTSKWQYKYSIDYDMSNYTYPTGQNYNTLGKQANPIPYGIGFTIWVDSIGINWENKLAAYTRHEAKNASYFNTEFGRFADDKKISDGVYHYTSDVAIMRPRYNGEKGAWTLQKVTNKVLGRNVDYLRLIELADPTVDKLIVTGGTQNGTYSGQDAMDILNAYFTITKVSDSNSHLFGLKFAPKTNTLDPTKIGQFRIKVKNSAKVMHQWGHTIAIDGKLTDSEDIFYNNPNSTPNLSRQSR